MWVYRKATIPPAAEKQRHDGSQQHENACVTPALLHTLALGDHDDDDERARRLPDGHLKSGLEWRFEWLKNQLLKYNKHYAASSRAAGTCPASSAAPSATSRARS